MAGPVRIHRAHGAPGGLGCHVAHGAPGGLGCHDAHGAPGGLGCHVAHGAHGGLGCHDVNGAKTGVGRLALLVLLAVAASACEGEHGLAPCEAPVTAAFDGLGGDPVAVVTLSGIRVEVLDGDAQGYHDGTRWTLLAVQGSTLGVTPPCGGAALEVVLDDTQVGLTILAYQDAWGGAALGSASSVEAVPVPEDPPYRRLTLTLPEGARAGYAEIVVDGSTCTDSCLSVLIRSVTLR